MRQNGDDDRIDLAKGSYYCFAVCNWNRFALFAV